MNKKMKSILLVIVFAVFIGAAVFAYNALNKKVAPKENADSLTNKSDTVQGTNKPHEKMKAPDFTVEDGNGNPVKLSDMFGKPIVLNFWASWCPPCKGEMPEFDTVYQELGDDIIFMMVDVVDGARETKSKGAEYIREQGFQFPVYFDVEQDAVYQYGVRAMPTTFFIDSDGYIVTGVERALDEKTLRRGIDMIRATE